MLIRIQFADGNDRLDLGNHEFRRRRGGLVEMFSVIR